MLKKSLIPDDPEIKLLYVQTITCPSLTFKSNQRSVIKP